ncbi:anthrone oxygenase family protein [Streptomyces sp. CAU 1734]|uniref:anthrone oxygenase family protein n=1 Tax=Streptomyces sp. CAU 1734 TaxID=3140360 RepID=UPI0032609666
MATALLALAIISNGLYAGFMLTFRTGIMPALARLTDEQFAAAMRRINEVVPRPLFLLTFFAIVVFPAVALVVPVEGRSGTQLWLIIAGLVCAVVNHLITVAGNVPLNNALAASEKSGEISDHEARTAFEPRWNRLHLIRTLFTIAAFALLVSAALS